MPDTALKNGEGHDDKWFHMSLGLKEGYPAAPIEFSIYHSFIMKDLKSRLLQNSDESVRVGFGSEEYKDHPLIRGNPPTKKLRWARMVEQTSKSINLLLFADDTTSLCRRSNMQERKEMLKQTLKDWKLILNDDKWEHIIAENGSDKERKWTKQQEFLALIGMPWVRFIIIKKTTHGGQESLVQVVKETSYMGPFERIGRSDCDSCCGRHTPLWM